MRAAGAIYRALLHAYPRAFRADVGDEMLAMFLMRYRDERARRGRRGLLGLWLRTLADVARNAPAERLAALRRPRDEGGLSMDALVHDIRHAVRSLVRRPGFLVVATLTLALGVGANAAIFGAVHAVLLRPLPYPDPDRLVLVRVAGPSGAPDLSASYPELVDWREGGTAFAGLAGTRGQSVNVTGDGPPERVSGSFITAEFFGLLGAQPLLGRGFTPAECDPPTAEPVAILAYGLWDRRFGADPAILGKHLTLNGRGHTIIGVMGPEFGADHEPANGFLQSADVYLPMAYFPNANGLKRGQGEIFVLGRMKPGVSLAAATADLAAVSARLEKVYPDTQKARRPHLTPIRELYLGDARAPMLILFGAVGLVLLIACVNVANLLLARASTREKELAVRSALGAGRGRLVRQLLCESVLLGVLGGGVGLLASHFILKAVVAFTPPGVTLPADVAIDGPVFLYTLAISVATGLLFGIFPALRASRPDLGQVIKGSQTSGPRPQRLRDGLVVAEAALSLMLLAGAALLLESAVMMTRANPGFRTDHLLTAQLRLPPTKYAKPEQIATFFAEFQARLEAAPGVESAALVRANPFGGNRGGAAVTLPDHPGEEILAISNIVSPGYFRTMGIPLLRGRDFGPEDTAQSPKVAIVNATLAARLGPEPLGKTIAVKDVGKLTVAGVAGDIQHSSLDEKPTPYVYALHAQNPLIFTEVAVRTKGDAAAFAPTLREALWSVDRDQPIWAVRTMDALLERHLRPTRALGLLVGVFAALAVLLAGVGLYGVMSYAVAQRTREIAIRMALGAPAGRVVRQVVGRGMTLAALAVVIGLAGALGLGRVLVSVLFGVGPADPLALAAAAVVLLLVCFVAAYLPARRAARVDPMVALVNGP